MIPSLRAMQIERERIAQQQKEREDRDSQTNKVKAASIAEASYDAFCGKHQGVIARQNQSLYTHTRANQKRLFDWILSKGAEVNELTLSRAFEVLKPSLSSEPDAEDVAATPAPEPAVERPPVPFTADQVRELAKERVLWNEAVKTYGWRELNDVLESAQ